MDGIPSLLMYLVALSSNTDQSAFHYSFQTEYLLSRMYCNRYCSVIQNSQYVCEIPKDL